MTNDELIKLYETDKELALELTKEQFGKRLFGTAMNILNNPQDAEECVNDALLKAWEVLPITKPEMLGAYLAKIARNLAINRYRAKNATKRGGGEIDVLLSELEDVIASGLTPEIEFEQAELRKTLARALEGMDKKTRIVFILRYFHSESISGISKHLKYTESKVKSILFRARNKLRTQLENEGVIV